ncbi:DNA-3-methyladenine glycosylase I [Campylobacter curvus]|uniref:DNA-3-methyladenine glycosylase I n=1 Tax=Campylobacter curvus TaxID=200 RepID=UPI00037C2FAF|nr:DNA-3-methyladenine glycosylase I [Campylobacter curvus]QKF60789.1 DNA-3-methyladenine glycosylase I, constitutive [Campylobacter curvus]UEB49111.1 DNA-3-methyladenine glycosylase I [Campylobacter curvus]
MKMRCEWCEKDDLYRAYHDNEWGEVVKDDRVLFEHIVLESMQAGISWHVVLKKREAMRAAFDGFDANIIKDYGDAEIKRFLADERLIRNRLKLSSLSHNARAFLAVQKEFGSFYAYIWSFTDGKRIVNSWSDIKQVPATTPLSDKVAKDMKKRGFKFLGSTSVYAFLQAIGVVDDHLDYCFKKGKDEKRGNF